MADPATCSFRQCPDSPLRAKWIFLRVCYYLINIENITVWHWMFLLTNVIHSDSCVLRTSYRFCIVIKSLWAQRAASISPSLCYWQHRGKTQNLSRDAETHAAMAELQVQFSLGTFFGRPSPSVVSPGGGQSKPMMETCCVTDVFQLEQLWSSLCFSLDSCFWPLQSLTDVYIYSEVLCFCQWTHVMKWSWHRDDIQCVHCSVNPAAFTASL